MTQPLLSRTECAALRGIAILGIVLHNFCHWLPPVVKENEFIYSQKNVDWLVQVMQSHDHLLPMHLLSFFGHYGVPVFLFLSAYGLVMKYEANDSMPHALPFVRYHFLKLFRMMFVGFMAFLLIDFMTPKPHHYAVTDIVAQLLLLNNLLPTPDRVIWPGPYWYFGLMFQIYVVYRLFLSKRGWKAPVAIAVLCTVGQMFYAPESDILNRLRYNFIGGMLPFAAGLLFARYGRQANMRPLFFLSVGIAMLIPLLRLGYYAWFLVPLAVCCLAVGIVKLFPKWLNNGLATVGNLSAMLFVVHPIARKVFIPISRRGDIYTGLLIYLLVSVALAWLFRELMKRVPSPKI